jgi:hypothetical protein
MVVVGAAFTAAAARDAARALAQLPGVAPDAIAHAPLGAVGRASEGKIIVAVCIAERGKERVTRIVDQVTRIVDHYGGEIVTRATYPEPDRADGSAALPGFGPIGLPGSAVGGRANN